jgi:hypothetical protein
MSGDHNANQKGVKVLAQIDAQPKPRQKVSERSARVTIGMMRTLARNIPVSPFHLHAADQMERMLDELLRLRKKHDGQETET